MDSWLNWDGHPATRRELHYGGRIIRCFAERPRSVHEMLANAVARRSDGLALICGNERVTYAELDARVGEAAGGLRALGVEKGDRVAIVLGNSVEFVVVLFAIARLGADLGSDQHPPYAGREQPHHQGLCGEGRRSRIRPRRPRSRSQRPAKSERRRRDSARRRLDARRVARRGSGSNGRSGRGRRDRDDPLYIRHHRPSERRDAHASRHRAFRDPLSRDDGADRK